VLLLLLPAFAVVWLGVRLIVQDRQLEAEQLRKRREGAADHGTPISSMADVHRRTSGVTRSLIGEHRHEVDRRASASPDVTMTT
jgi:hypothetical protein